MRHKRLTPYDTGKLTSVWYGRVVGIREGHDPKWRYYELHYPERPTILTSWTIRMESIGIVSINTYSNTRASVVLTQAGRDAFQFKLR